MTKAISKYIINNNYNKISKTVLNICRQIIDHHKSNNIIQVNKWNGYELYKQEKNNNYNMTMSISKT